MSLEFTEKEKDYFWNNIIKTEKCWYWIGRQTKDGYGVFFHKGSILYCHRISFELLICPIPESKPQLDHYCYTRNCVNPDHLLPTTHAGNMRTRRKHEANYNENFNFAEPYFKTKDDYIKMQKSHCIIGHEIKYLKVDKNGKARCVDCLEDAERIDLRNWDSLIQRPKNDSASSFRTVFDTAYPKIGANVIKQKLLIDGINTYSKSTVSAMKYLEDALRLKLFNIIDLAKLYGLKPTITKLRKISYNEGVLIE